MKTFKEILQVISALCVLICPMTFVLTFVGLLIFDADLFIYSLFTGCLTGVYVFVYEACTNEILK